MLNFVVFLVVGASANTLCYPPAKAGNVIELKQLIERDLIANLSQIDLVSGTINQQNDDIKEVVNNHQAVSIRQSYNVTYSYKQQSNEMCGTLTFYEEG